MRSKELVDTPPKSLMVIEVLSGCIKGSPGGQLIVRATIHCVSLEGKRLRDFNP